MSESLRQQLRVHLLDVDAQIAEAKKHAAELGIPLVEMRYSDGTFVASPLILAKAQVLNGLAALEAAKKSG